jgi:hypothetical protein
LRFWILQDHADMLCNVKNMLFEGSLAEDLDIASHSAPKNYRKDPIQVQAQGCLPSAVGAHNAQVFTLLHFEVDIL